MKLRKETFITITMSPIEAQLLEELVNEGLCNINNAQAGKDPQRGKFTDLEQEFLRDLGYAFEDL